MLLLLLLLLLLFIECMLCALFAFVLILLFMFAICVPSVYDGLYDDLGVVLNGIFKDALILA